MIRPIMAMLIPVGGVYTIDAKTAAEVAKQIGPKVTVPMHYKVEGLGYPIQGVEPFVKAAGGAKKVNSTEIELSPDMLATYAGVAIMEYK